MERIGSSCRLSGRSWLSLKASDEALLSGHMDEITVGEERRGKSVFGVELTALIWN